MKNKEIEISIKVKYFGEVFEVVVDSFEDLEKSVYTVIENAINRRIGSLEDDIVADIVAETICPECHWPVDEHFNKCSKYKGAKIGSNLAKSVWEKDGLERHIDTI